MLGFRNILFRLLICSIGSTLSAARMEPEARIVKFPNGHKEDYALVPLYPGSEEKIIDINFLDDAAALADTLGTLQEHIPEDTEILVVTGEKVSILGDRLASKLELPLVVLRTEEPRTKVFAEVEYPVPQGTKTFYLSQDKAELIQGKRVTILADIVYKGETLSAAVKLVKKAKAEILGLVTAFTEGYRRASLRVDGIKYSLFAGSHLNVEK